MTQVLSHGGGVQTRALVRLILESTIARPDLIVFSDTGDEPQAIYDGLARDRSDCKAAGIPFYIVSEGRRLGDAMLEGPGVYAPVFTTSDKQPEGRYPFKSCTDRFKITPIVKHLKLLGLTEWTTWLGFTTDEIERVKPSKISCATNIYPLIEMNMNRGDCEAVLNRYGLPIVKSSCTFCPNRSRAMWRMVAEQPVEFARVVAIDEAIRHREPGCETFLHRARKPISECIDLTQPSLFGDSCDSGYCGT